MVSIQAAGRRAGRGSGWARAAEIAAAFRRPRSSLLYRPRNGDSQRQQREEVDAPRRLPDDVHAAPRHHGRGRRAPEHAGALRCQLDWLAVGRRRLCAQPCRVDPHCGRARRQIRASPGLHGRRRCSSPSPRSSAASPGTSRRSTSPARCRGSAAPHSSRPHWRSSATSTAGTTSSERLPSGAPRWGLRLPPARSSAVSSPMASGGAGSSSSTFRSASSHSRLPSPVSRSPGTRARDTRT